MPAAILAAAKDGDVVITMDVLGEPHRVGGLLKTLLDAMNTEPAQ